MNNNKKSVYATNKIYVKAPKNESRGDPKSSLIKKDVDLRAKTAKG